METLLSNNVPNETKDEDVNMRDSPAAVVVEPDSIVNPDTEKECSPSSMPRSSYTPQFSSASWILDLIRNDQEPPSSSLPTESGAATQTEEERNNIPNGHAGSSIHDTLIMPPSSNHLPLGSAANIIEATRRVGLKRKRERDGEVDDFTQNTMSLPIPSPTSTETLSVVLPYTDTSRCSKCGISSMESPMPLLGCSNCSRWWHGSCMTWTLRKVKSQVALKMVCSLCTNVSDDELINNGTRYPRPWSEIERVRAKNLASLPINVVPAKEELVGFWPGRTSDAALVDYFDRKTKTDVLNILSFCDQLKPQLLVDIMVSVAKKHPDLPIFNSPHWNLEAMTSIAARAKRSQQGSRSATRLRHGHTVLESRARHKHKASKKTIKMVSIPKEEESPPLMDNRDSLPPMWPKAGEGLYAKLSPENDDRAFLLDENDEEAFSHFGVDKFGKQIAVPVSS